MPTSVPPLPTIGEIGRRLGVAVHRVEYHIRARGIKPCGWAGNARVFPEDVVESIASALGQERPESGQVRNVLDTDNKP
jgi:hypothetical protein